MRRFFNPVLPLIVMLVAVAIPAQAAKSKKKLQDAILKADFPEISEAHRALTKVPGAVGAPAVVLLNAKQTDWEELQFQRIRYLRRIKILTDAGVTDHGDFRYQLWGDWRVNKVKARTVLPDGTIVDASDSVFQEKSEDREYREVRVAFPRVQVGAILDVMVEMNASAWTPLGPWIAQEGIPVLESRFTILPPTGLKFFPMAFPPDLATPQDVAFGTKKAFVWTFRDLPPLPDVEFLPADWDIAQRLVVILAAYKDRTQFLGLATDWKEFSKWRHGRWKDWTDASHRNAASLAREVVGEAKTDSDKAEAIRRAVRERVTSDYGWDYPVHTSPDEVLERGAGNSADLAGLNLAMLQAVGVKADLVALRRRSGGTIPLNRPVPALLNELLVRLPGATPVYYSPAAALSVGKLPWDCTGVATIALDGKSEKVVMIPDNAADDNATERKTTAELHADGLLTGTSVHTFRGSAADRWRRRMSRLDDEKRNERFTRELARHMEGVQIESLEIEQLDGPGDELVVKTAWEVAGYAANAGSRLIVNPNLFSRQSGTGWSETTRAFPINLERAFEERDSVTIKLPEGVGNVDLPGSADLNAGPVGLFKSSYQRRGDTIVVERHMRLNVYAFAPDAYTPLSRWFSAAATSDDRPVVANIER